MKLKGIINSEKHAFEVDPTTYNPSSSGAMTTLSSVAVGDTYATRTGNSILAKGLTIRGTLGIHASATNTYCRIIVFQDKNASPFTTVASILQSGDLTEQINWNNKPDFRLLSDRTFSLNNSGKNNVVVNKYIPLNTHIHYQGTNGTDWNKGQILILYISNEATNTPTFKFSSRLEFYDN